MITLRQIEAFRATMTTGTVTEAGNILGISQPAVSRLLSDLEQELGFKLFNRDNRSLEPTAEGDAFNTEVQHAFIGLDHLARAANEIRNLNSGHLRLIIIPALAHSGVMSAISAFAKLYPNVMISLEVEPSHRIYEWVISRQCDLGIATLPIDSPAAATKVISRGPAVCLINQSDPLREKTYITPEDLADIPFISFKADTLFRHRVDSVFRAASVNRRMKVEARSTEAVFSLVAAGLGASIVQCGFPDRGDFPGVVVKPFKPILTTELVAFYNRNHQPSLIATQFLNTLQNCLPQQGIELVQ